MKTVWKMAYSFSELVCVLLVLRCACIAACPAECVCVQSTDAQTGVEGYVVSCIDLTELPIPWPEDMSPVFEFHLSELNVKELPRGLFKDMKSIRRIDIRFSTIDSIGANAFSGLSGLGNDAVLMLSYNRIGVISTKAFNGLENFASIQINGGSVGSLQPHAFNDIDTGSIIISSAQIGDIRANAVSSLRFHTNFSLPSALKSLPAEILRRFPSLNSVGFSGCENLTISNSLASFVSIISNFIKSLASESFADLGKPSW
jgi:hypothetical protein